MLEEQGREVRLRGRAPSMVWVSRTGMGAGEHQGLVRLGWWFWHCVCTLLFFVTVRVGCLSHSLGSNRREKGQALRQRGRL